MHLICTEDGSKCLARDNYTGYLFWTDYLSSAEMYKSINDITDRWPLIKQSIWGTKMPGKPVIAEMTYVLTDISLE